MSFFAGCDFFMVLFILLIPAVLLGLSEKKLKWYRWLLSLFFIWEVYGSTKIQLLYLIGYVIFAAYLVKIYLYLRKKYGRNKYIYGHAVFLSLLPLLVYKIGGLRGYSVFGFLGISYICFKIIQVVIECYDGVIKEIDEFQFIEFLIFSRVLVPVPLTEAGDLRRMIIRSGPARNILNYCGRACIRSSSVYSIKSPVRVFSIIFCKLISQGDTGLYTWLGMLTFTGYICFSTLPDIALWLLAPVTCLESKRRITLINPF